MRQTRTWCALAGLLALLALVPAPAAAATDEEVEDSVAAALAWVRAQQQPDGSLGSSGGLDSAWALLGIAATGLHPADLRAGPGLPSAQDHYLGLWTGSDDTAWTSLGVPQATDYARVILLARAAGLDPARLSAGQNLLAKLAGNYRDGYFTSQASLFNHTLFGLLALAQLPVPEWVAERSAAIVAANRHADGGYTSYPVTGEATYNAESDIDSTGMALAALCGAGRTADDPAVAGGLAFLAAKRAPSGAIGNVDSTSWALDGMGACGIVRGSVAWTADDEATVDWLLEEQLDAGPNAGAWGSAADPDPYATQDALRALADAAFAVQPPAREDPGDPVWLPPPAVAAGVEVPVVLAIDAGFGDVRLCATRAPVGAALPDVLAAARAESTPAGCVETFSFEGGALTRIDGIAANQPAGGWKLSLDAGPESPATGQAVGFGKVVGLRLEGRGTVSAWGRDHRGQLGLGTTAARRFDPLPSPALGEAADAAIGLEHSLVLAGNGALLASGENDLGQLGDGTEAASATPVRPALPDDAEVTAVAAGESHSLALLEDGRVFAWGENEFGQLGDGSEEAALAPVEVDLSGFDSPPVDVFAANWSSYALLEDGALLGWGRNSGGQLGDGSEEQKLTPVAADLSGFAAGVESAAVGDDNVLALLGDGELVGWGANFTGQVGDGTEVNRPAPVAVDVSEFGSPVAEVSLGRDHSLALLADGRVLAWGANPDFQLGSEEENDRLEPGLVPGIDDAVEIAATYATSTVRRSDGSVWAWGQAVLGQLGAGEGLQADTATPIEAGLTRADALAEGWSAKHMLALTVAEPPPDPEEPPDGGDGGGDSSGAPDPAGPAGPVAALPPAPPHATAPRRVRRRHAVHVRCRTARRGHLVCQVTDRTAGERRGRASARLLRRGRVYAAGTLRRMRAKRRIRPGRYLLVVGKGRRTRRFAARVTVTGPNSLSHPVNQRRRHHR
jgi:alpha-tubulin suppressor-like RCC1 family protein